MSPLLDRTKIRRDILNILDEEVPVRLDALKEFLGKKENHLIEFRPLWNKVMDGNMRWYREGNLDWYKEDFLTKEEMIFLARMHRHIIEYISNHKQKLTPIPDNVEIKTTKINGVSVEWQTVPEAVYERVLVYFHGGGWILGSPNSHRLSTVNLGRTIKMRVLSVDYRLAPEHPYPAGVEDCVSVYIGLIESGIKPENIILGGDSAGGHYTLMTLLNLKEKKIPMPKAGICLAPATDLTLSTKSSSENLPTDAVLGDLGCFWWSKSFLAGRDPKKPDISPLYGDLKGLPALLMQASTSEILIDEIKQFYKKAKEAGVDVKLQIWDNTLHVFQNRPELPEAKEALNKISEFVQRLFD
ncbi:MAG: alpha/beta hydrolase [Promethearchaeota archaeon]